MKYTRAIKKKGTFKYLFNKGKVSRGNYLNVYYNFLDKKYNTFGVCVSKKNGNSISRNKIKRWVREVYKVNEGSLKKGLNIIFLMKKNITFKDINFFDIKKDIEDILINENLYENN